MRSGLGSGHGFESSRPAEAGGNSGSVLVEDLGSSNGTSISGRRIEQEGIAHAGDAIGFGSYVLVLLLSSRARNASTGTILIELDSEVVSTPLRLAPEV